MKKQTPTSRVWLGLSPFTDEQYAARKKRNKAARKARKINRKS